MQQTFICWRPPKWLKVVFYTILSLPTFEFNQCLVFVVSNAPFLTLRIHILLYAGHLFQVWSVAVRLCPYAVHIAIFLCRVHIADSIHT